MCSSRRRAGRAETSSGSLAPGAVGPRAGQGSAARDVVYRRQELIRSRCRSRAHAAGPLRQAHLGAAWSKERARQRIEMGLRESQGTHRGKKWKKSLQRRLGPDRGQIEVQAKEFN